MFHYILQREKPLCVWPGHSEGDWARCTRRQLLATVLNPSMLELLPVLNTMKSQEERFRRLQALRYLEDHRVG